MLDLLYVNKSIISADHLPICFNWLRYIIASSSDIFFIKLGLNVLSLICLAKLLIPITFCLLKPQDLNCDEFNFSTLFTFILFEHLSLNLKKTAFAAATLICCPIILLHNEKKISFRVVKIASLGPE